MRAQSLDHGRFTVMDQLTAAAVLGDDARVRGGDAALYTEEVVRLDAIHRAVRADLLVDSGLSRLRTAMERALADQSADLDRVAAWYTAPTVSSEVPPQERSLLTVAAIDRAYQLLDVELHRFRLARRPLPAAPPFRAADPTLSFLRHIANTPTRSRLVVATEDGRLSLVDIDANRITAAHLVGLPASFEPTLVVARRSYVVLSDPNGLSFIVSPDLQGGARPLGADTRVVAAADADDVWLQELNGSLVEEDGQGHVLLGPVRFPEGTNLFGAVDAGVVLALFDARGFQTRLIVWDPATQTIVRTLTTAPSQVMAVDHNTVVWLQGDTATPDHAIVHVTTVSTGLDRTVLADPNLAPTGDQWSISPDGTTLASIWWTKPATPDANGTYAPAFINVDTRRFTFVPVALPAPAASTIEWANAGDRVFLTSYNNSFGTAGILTYQLGSQTIEQLRLPKASNTVASAVLLPDNPPS